jgi:hypothetical protein
MKPTELPNFCGKLYTACQDGYVFRFEIAKLDVKPTTIKYNDYAEDIEIVLFTNKEKNSISIHVSLPAWTYCIPGKSGLFISHFQINEYSDCCLVVVDIPKEKIKYSYHYKIPDNLTEKTLYVGLLNCDRDLP